MKYFFAMAVAALAIVGCKKEPSGADDPASGPGQTTNSSTAPLPPAPTYVTANAQNRPAENVGGEVNAFLTQQLQIFIQQKKRVPQSFAEFASARLDSIPRPPDGQKWVIDTATRQVKAAPVN